MFAVASSLRGLGVFALAPAGLTFLVGAFVLRIPTDDERAVLMSGAPAGRQSHGPVPAAANQHGPAAEQH